jgi:hypothetical protein
MADCLRGHDGTIGERLECDLAAFQTLPSAPYDACEKFAMRVSSLALVRDRLNDYSVPTSYGHRDVLVRGYVHKVVISCGAEVTARHPRCYEREAFVFERARSIRAGQAADREFDAAAGEFAPGFDFRHVGRLRELREIGARFDPCLAAFERIGLAPPSVHVGRRLRPRPFGETARDVRRCFLFSGHFCRRSWGKTREESYHSGETRRAKP